MTKAFLDALGAAGPSADRAWRTNVEFTARRVV
jgi:hypothetical protein